jgi:hypothetical protein
VTLQFEAEQADLDARSADTDAQVTDAAGSRSIGQVAAMLGVAPETVRSWGRRYGLVASGHSTGGHRRFSDGDVSILQHMQDLVAQGFAPAEAARRAAPAALSGAAPAALSGAAPAASSGAAPGLVPAMSSERSSASGSARAAAHRPGPGGRVLAVPGGSARVRGLARAASRLDARAAADLITRLLSTEGVLRTWDSVLVPVLRAAGRRWMESGEGVDIEHVLSEAIIEALHAHSAAAPPPARGRMILLASAPEDIHTLPLHVLAAALRERRIPCLMAGARVPFEVVGTAARRTGSAGVLLWAQMSTGDCSAPLARLRRELRPVAPLVLAGPGWAGVPVARGVYRPNSLGDAVDVLVRASR